MNSTYVPWHALQAVFFFLYLISFPSYCSYSSLFIYIQIFSFFDSFKWFPSSYELKLLPFSPLHGFRTLHSSTVSHNFYSFAISAELSGRVVKKEKRTPKIRRRLLSCIKSQCKMEIIEFIQFHLLGNRRIQTNFVGILYNSAFHFFLALFNFLFALFLR